LVVRRPSLLQRAATDCNTLQHRITCKAVCTFLLQHAATHCNTLQSTATHCESAGDIFGPTPNTQTHTLCISVCTCISTQTYMCMYVYTHTRTHTYVYTYTHTHTYIHTPYHHIQNWHMIPNWHCMPVNILVSKLTRSYPAKSSFIWSTQLSYGVRRIGT